MSNDPERKRFFQKLYGVMRGPMPADPRIELWRDEKGSWVAKSNFPIPVRTSYYLDQFLKALKDLHP